MGENVRKLGPGRLIIASHNDGKAKEINELLSPLGVEAASGKKLGLNDPEETGTTFAENAKLKALTAATAANLPALADDSGLAVTALLVCVPAFRGGPADGGVRLLREALPEAAPERRVRETRDSSTPRERWEALATERSELSAALGARSRTTAVLAGTLVTERGRVARVDGRLVGVGEAPWPGARVVEIGERSVTIDEGGAVRLYELGGLPLELEEPLGEGAGR